ncbi:MAG: YidC/Oxa1 family membrane protein insertase [Acidimicrobiales bacterium]
MFDLIAAVLSFFYDLVPSYAVAIALLTLAVMVVLTPLTLKSTRSMLQLQALQPELKKLQAQYKDDRQKLNEEMMKFYAEHKINPLGGCLPMLLQLPVFFILYNVVRGLTTRTSVLDAVAQGDPGAAGTFDPKYLDSATPLYRALHESTEMLSFGVDLSRTATQAISDGLATGWPYLVLVILTAGTSYVQQAQIQRRATGPVNPQMQMITKILPIFFVFISLTIPAAVVIYFVISGLYRIAQQQLITHSIYKPHNAQLAASGEPITTTAVEEDASPSAKPAKAAQAVSAKPANGAPRSSAGGRSQPSAPTRRPAAAAAPGAARGGLLGRLRTGGQVAATPATETPNARSSNGAAPPMRASGRVTPPGSRSAPNRPTKKKKRK